MLTVQHSEELAVWAFRSRVWDYLVKPVAAGEIERCYQSLQRAMRPDSHTRPPAPLPMPPEAGPPSHKDARMSRAAQYMTAHLDEKLSEAKLAAMCGLSVYAFSRAFHAAFDQTFQSYLVERRMERARELLENPNLRIADVALQTGFNDASYFSRVFRQRYSMTPSQWQRAAHPEGGEDDRAAYRPALRLGLDDTHPPGPGSQLRPPR